MGRNAPLDLPDALAMAFTATALAVIGEPELLAIESGEDMGGLRRVAYEGLAVELGMKRETLRLTIQGARWVTLPEIAKALSSAVVGPTLQAEIEHHLSLLAGVLHKDQDSGRRQGSAGEGERVGSSRNRQATGRSTDMTVIEARIRSDVTRLDQLIARAARSGASVETTADWAAIRRMVGAARQPANRQPGVGMAGRVRRAGVPNLTELVRSHLRDRDDVRTYVVRAAIQRQHSAITADQIDAAFARLYQRGEAQRLARGLYRATKKMKHEGD